jgi:hypothetical protein
LLVTEHPRFHTLAPCLSEFRCEWSVNHPSGQCSWEWVYLHILWDFLKWVPVARHPHYI